MPAAAGRAARCVQVEKLLAERTWQRSSVRVTGISRTTVAGRVKKALLASPPLPRLRPKQAQKKRWEALELDEMWPFAGRKQRKVWLWLAVERANRRIMTWVTGRRDAATAQRLWSALPGLPPPLLIFHRRVESLRGRVAALATSPCHKGSGGTGIAEAVNCALRHRCGVLVRKSCSFSKSLDRHQARIKIVIDS